MASYCEVCQSTCFPPHQHTLLWHRLSSSSSPSVPLPPPRGSTRSISPFSHGRGVRVEQRSTTPSCGLVSSQPRRSGSVPCAAPAASPRRWAAVPTALRSSCQLRSFSEPVRRFPRKKDATSSPSHRLRAPTPPPLPASVLRRRANQNAGDAGRGFAVDTFNSLLRAEGSIPPFDFMRRGEGIVGTRHPSRPPSQTSSPLPPSRSPMTGFLDTFDPHRALAERCCYPSLLPDAHRRHTDGRVAQSAHRDAHPSDSTDRSGTTSSSLPVEESARLVPAPTVGETHPDATKRRSRSAPKVESHEHGRRGLSPVSPTGASTTPVVSMREHVHAAQQRHPRHNSHDSERSSTPKITRPPAKASASAYRPSSPAQLLHPLGDLIERIRAEVRADAAHGHGKLQAKTEKSEKRKKAGQAGTTSATTQREAGKAAEEDAGGSPTTSCPVSSIEFSHAAAKRAKQHAAVPKHEAGRKDALHQSAALHTSGGDAISSSDDDEEAGRSSGKDAKHPPRLQSRLPNTPHKARHPSVLPEESRSRSVTQKITQHHRRRRASSSSSSASSLTSASSSASSVSRSSSAQLRRAVQKAQSVLQQMRQRARERGGAENSNEERTKKGRRRTLSRHSGADVGGRGKREEEAAGRRRESHARPRLGQMTAEDDDVDFLYEASPSPSKDARRESRRHSHSRVLFQTRQPRDAVAAAETGAARPLKEVITPAHAALVEEEVRATLPRIIAKLERQQADWCGEQDHRIERLREGLASLCVAVRKDLRKMREDVEALWGQVSEAAASRRAEASQRPAPHPGATAQPRPETFSPECVVTWVGQSSASDKRRLAHLLLPHLQPALADVIEAEVRRQLRTVTAEQQTQQRDAEARLHAYVDAAITTADTKRSLERDDGGGATAAAAAAAGAPIWAGFSSADAFDAHLRATARAVLVEEDDRRYSLVNENERRHELRVREMQQHWQDTLSEAELAWRAAWKGMLDKAGEAWQKRTQAPLQEHADLIQTIVTALTRDVTHLQAQQDAQAAAVHEMLRTEREMRQQEQAKLKERVEQRVVQLLPREVESACVRYHVQRERQASTALRGTRAASHDGGGGGSPLSASPAAQLTAEELRLSVVQPALDHMRRLLVSHQEMMSAAVEDRCCRAERAVEGSRHVWLQNVTELRGKVSALRSDVRGAFNELCTSLNVASPAM